VKEENVQNEHCVPQYTVCDALQFIIILDNSSRLMLILYIPCTPNTSLPSLSSVHTVLHDHKDGTSL